VQTIYSTGQAARILGVKAHQIMYAIANRLVPESEFRFLNKRCFSAANIRQLADHFGVEITVDEAGLNGKPPTLSP
jgi:hypothetical protein